MRFDWLITPEVGVFLLTYQVHWNNKQQQQQQQQQQQYATEPCCF